MKKYKLGALNVSDKGLQDTKEEIVIELIDRMQKYVADGKAGGNMVQADMRYFVGNGPADFILWGVVIVADNKGLRRFAPQYEAVFVIVRL